ncbi:DUF3014 domain-containing protein [Halioxenophilus sp. WMMB6]|uniref:DUF3014 domain-containing protein n=1 Tax=Halioxenophilus sp. WMMB6 TaxID=3073815 RepID=UPI00295F3009|nr:DUF3014 domain-containing protein [Halioxenophilus sp. WMMB6]
MSERIGDVYEKSGNATLIWAGVGIVIGIVIVAGWWYLQPKEEPLASVTPVPASALESAPAPNPAIDFSRVPSIPEPAAEPESTPETTAQSSPPVTKPEPLPALAESDAVVRDYFVPLSENVNYRLLWQADNLIERWVTVISGASRGSLIGGILSFQQPAGAFPVTTRNGHIYLDEKGYQRFQPIVATLINLKPEALVAGFHRFRPLLEESFGFLGYPAKDFDKCLITLLDEVINAPIFVGPIELNSTSVLYTFAEPELEELTALEKQLIRMGPENTSQLQRYAKTVRNLLLKSGG